ncbi:MAG TPA: hypothetical protein VEK08_02920 [Planctomycetota bacterium]|nr:hypothetical protein [Planctomycetota bacterium]
MKNVFMLAAAALLLSASAFAAHDEYSRVELKGTLHNDSQERRATLKVNGVTYELDLGNNRDFFRQAERLDRQQVVVNGQLYVEKSREGDTFLVVAPDQIQSAEPQNVQYQRRETVVREEPVVRERRVYPRERVIIKEKDSPIFKAGPLEINP